MAVFLFTDIEKSTEKWEKHPNEMKKNLAQHDSILNENVKKFGGKVIKHTGDGIFAVFEKGDPLKCAFEIQKGLGNINWGIVGELRIRIGLHAGQAEKVGEDYFGSVINKTARVMAAGWGGQILLTPQVKEICSLPANCELKDLGTHMLKDLGEPQQIYGLIHPELTIKEFPTLRSLSAYPNNLPPQQTVFVGREEELAELAELLDDQTYRLTTLVGPGGIGKTRLAIQLGAEHIEKFRDGIYFIPLASLTISSIEFLVFAIADAIKFSFYSKEDPKIQLLNYLREKEMLLIFDNFEHLLDVADLISEIINNAQKLRILVTSREVLNLKSEGIFQVAGLEIPESEKGDIKDYSAVALFIQNALRVYPDFVLSEKDQKLVIQICRLVGGVPLAIELSSTWVKILSLGEVLSEIERNIDFLATSMRDVPEKHRSLRAVFDYSWNMLKDEEKMVFKKMSVFRGGFRRDAAEKIAGATMPSLSSLIDKSLLRRNPNGRYEMLEILRHYAWEKLEDDPQEKEALLNLHSEYYANFLSKNEKNLQGKKQVETLKKIGAEIENIRTGWNQAIKQANVKNIEISLDPIFRFLTLQGRFMDGQEFLHKTISMLKGADPEISTKALARYGVFLFRIGSTDKAEEILDKCLKTFQKLDIKKEIAFVFNQLGYIYRLKGDFKKAAEIHQKSLEVYDTIGDLDGKASAIYNLGSTSYRFGEFSKAKEYYKQGLEIAEELEDPMGRATAFNNLGLVAGRLGDFEQAKEMYEAGLEICRQMDNQYGIASALLNLGNISYYLGDYQEAKRSYLGSYEIYHNIGDRDGEALCYNNAGLIYRLLEDYNEARRMAKKSLSLYRKIGDQKGIALCLANLGIIASRQKDYEEAERLYKESLALYQKAGIPTGEAEVLDDLATVNYKRGRYNEAEQHLYNALKIAYKTKATPLIINILVSFMPILLHKGDKQKTLEICRIALKHPSAMKEMKEKAEEQLKDLRSVLPEQKIADILERKEEIKLEKFVEEMLKDH